MIRSIFAPPVFEKPEDKFRAQFINAFCWGSILLLGFASAQFINPFNSTLVVLSGLILVMFAALYLLRQRNIAASASIIVVLGWLGIFIQATNADGAKDVIVIAFIALGLLASIVLSWVAGSIVILSSIAAIWALIYLELNDLVIVRIQEPIQYGRDLSFIFIVIMILLVSSSSSLRDALNRARKSEDELTISNKELKDLNQSLEDRVNSRTAALETANQVSAKRARQFEAIAQVARATTTNESLVTLFPRLASLISEQFGYYHVGIFLIDENREMAVLSATNSEGGKRMLNRGHKLQIGQTGIVGFVSGTGSARISSDVGTDAVYFDNPDLPDTHSEMALPLRIQDTIIGVLDIQSTEINAFVEEDIEVLSTLADQVAIAVQNARTYEEMGRLLEEAQKVSGSIIQDSWRVLQTEETILGYRAAGNKINPLARPLSAAHIRKAMENREIVLNNGANAALAIPILLRNEVIGVMDIRTPDDHEWDEDEVDIARSVAERLSLALETSLLLKSTQRRAELERITTDISTRISASTQFDTILRTAAEELSRVLGGSEVLVQLQSALGTKNDMQEEK